MAKGKNHDFSIEGPLETAFWKSAIYARKYLSSVDATNPTDGKVEYLNSTFKVSSYEDEHQVPEVIHHFSLYID